MKRLNENRRNGAFKYPHGHDNTGLKSLHEAEEDAVRGSEMLFEKLNSAFFKFAWRHRITEEEARHLLLNTGVRLPERLAA